MPIASGSTDAVHSIIQLRALELHEPGVYQMRLTVEDLQEAQERVDTVQFTITP